jgi:Leucine-rich repeat (LRR) protein
MMPNNLEYLFMMENEGITTLPASLFDNLPAPEKLKALYFDDCNIETMDEEVFHPLVNLEVLNLPFNKITLLQDNLLKLPKLRQFTIYGDPTTSDPPFMDGGGRKPGMLTSDSFTNKLFQYTPNLERLIMYGHPGIDKLHAGMFNG